MISKQDESKEIWKTIVLDNKITNYEVSNFGRVKNIKTGKYLAGTDARNEYLNVQLFINKKPRTLGVHRLVAQAFCPNPNNYKIVDHIDMNKHNNVASNLRWASVLDNANNCLRIRKEKIDYADNIDDFVDIPGQPGFKVSKDGVIINSFTYRILKGGFRNGYRRVMLRGINYSVHRIVWESFNGPIPSGYVIDHIDGNKKNNNLQNLRVVSQSENMNNSYRNGHHTAKGVIRYSKDGKLLERYPSLAVASQNFNCTSQSIGSAIKRGGSCQGFLWTWDDENASLKIEELVKKNSVDSHCTSITAYNLDGSKYQHFSSIKEACQKIGCNCSTIIRGYQNKRKAKGYYWVPDSADFTINDILKNSNTLK